MEIMGSNVRRITYKGYRTATGLEVVVHRPGQRLRLLYLPRRPDEWGLRILTDYLGDEDRAANLHHDFDALTIRRFTTDWELSESDMENVLVEVEILRARWRIALARG
jgi:hypothetical protein